MPIWEAVTGVSWAHSYGRDLVYDGACHGG